MTKATVVGTVDDLCAQAIQRAGHSDFGADEDNFREALSVLLDSYEREAGFTPLGATMTRHYLLGGLVARLLSEAAWKRHPSHANVSIERPIFVTGLPRTGTTALHRLLGADPAHQGLELWLAEYPQPRPPREDWDSYPEYRQLQAYYAKAHRENPEFLGLHYIAEDVLEECWQLLRQSVHSVSYESLAHVPTYAQWLSNQDWAPSYRRHRRNLQLIGLNDASKRWVLKNPSHLFSIDAIFETYPDALIVQCHRPPETLLPSMCSLAEHSTKGWSNTFSREQIGHDTLDTWSRAIERFTSSRAKYNPNQFYDVDYFDFVAAPVDTVRTIYEHFGFPLTEEAVSAIGSAHEESQLDHRAPKHRYSLDDYGLTPDAVKARFEHW
ncbi:sulfotransferase [Mycobacterium ahvazicum]|uniref:Sulfotransferase n=1 Tax=Mycobacterium ahvazicum TaxID=1964395 RepID=A0A2K4YAT6_9MYCO|nr:sulfotransferase [Mycobacterium ahvazicum]SOX53857.1 sulfotransferase [Mycobacterium ahvazicum]